MCVNKICFYICIYRKTLSIYIDTYIYIYIYWDMIYIPESSKGSEILAPFFLPPKTRPGRPEIWHPWSQWLKLHVPHLRLAATRNSREAQHWRNHTPKRFFLSRENVSGRGDPQAFKSSCNRNGCVQIFLKTNPIILGWNSSTSNQIQVWCQIIIIEKLITQKTSS